MLGSDSANLEFTVNGNLVFTLRVWRLSLGEVLPFRLVSKNYFIIQNRISKSRILFTGQYIQIFATYVAIMQWGKNISA